MDITEEIKTTQSFVQKCHQVSGAIMEKSAHADILMCNALRVMTGLDASMAQAIFYTLDSIKPRCQMLRRVMKASRKSDLIKPIEQIISSSQKINNQRTKLAHSIITISDIGPDGKMIAYNPKNFDPEKIQPLTDGYLRDRLEQANSGLKELIEAYAEICRVLGVPATLTA